MAHNPLNQLKQSPRCNRVGPFTYLKPLLKRTNVLIYRTDRHLVRCLLMEMYVQEVKKSECCRQAVAIWYKWYGDMVVLHFAMRYHADKRIRLFICLHIFTCHSMSYHQVVYMDWRWGAGATFCFGSIGIVAIERNFSCVILDNSDFIHIVRTLDAVFFVLCLNIRRLVWSYACMLQAFLLKRGLDSTVGIALNKTFGIVCVCCSNFEFYREHLNNFRCSFDYIGSETDEICL